MQTLITLGYGRMTQSKDQQQFREARYFSELDGLRAISVLLVLAVHMRDPLWRPLHGYLGVTVFFVISGWLITTLLLREQRREGHISLRGFYIRRAFRILPLYYLALIVFSLAVAAGLADDAGDYGHRLTFFLTFSNEFAGPGTFGHSWSLGVEEKFYFLWPLLAFVLPMTARRRPVIVFALLTSSVLAAGIGVLDYWAIYTPILAGCALALACDSERGFGVVRYVARPLVGLPLVLLAAALGSIADGDEGHVHVLFSLAAAATFPLWIIGPNAIRRVLRARWLVWIGSRSYAFYLFHPMTISLVDKVWDRGSENVSVEVARFLVSAGLTLIACEVVHRLIEGPLVDFGRRLSGKRATRAVAITSSA